MISANKFAYLAKKQYLCNRICTYMRGGGEKRLYEFRLMYNAYPQLSEQVLSFVLKFSKKDILRLLTAESQNAIIWRTTSAELKQQTW